MASELWLMKKQVLNLAKGTQVSNASEFLVQFTEHQEYKSYIPHNNHDQKLNNHDQIKPNQSFNELQFNPQQFLNSPSGTVIPSKDTHCYHFLCYPNLSLVFNACMRDCNNKGQLIPIKCPQKFS